MADSAARAANGGGPPGKGDLRRTGARMSNDLWLQAWDEETTPTEDMADHGDGHGRMSQEEYG